MLYPLSISLFLPSGSVQTPLPQERLSLPIISEQVIPQFLPIPTPCDFMICAFIHLFTDFCKPVRTVTTTACLLRIPGSGHSARRWVGALQSTSLASGPWSPCTCALCHEPRSALPLWLGWISPPLHLNLATWLASASRIRRKGPSALRAWAPRDLVHICCHPGKDVPGSPMGLRKGRRTTPRQAQPRAADPQIQEQK